MTENLQPFAIDDFLPVLAAQLEVRGNERLSTLFAGTSKELMTDNSYGQGGHGLVDYMIGELGGPGEDIEDQGKNLANLSGDKINAAVQKFFNDPEIKRQLGARFAVHQSATLALTQRAIIILLKEIQREAQFAEIEIVPKPSFKLAPNLCRNGWRDVLPALWQRMLKFYANKRLESALENSNQYNPRLQEIMHWITAGADANKQAFSGMVPLHYVTRYGGTAGMVQILIAAGADVNKKDREWQTPLHYVMRYGGMAETAQTLLGAGANANEKDLEEGRTPLYWAAVRGTMEMVQGLCAAGADPTQCTKELRLASDGGWDPQNASQFVRHNKAASEDERQEMVAFLKQAEQDLLEKQSSPHIKSGAGVNANGNFRPHQRAAHHLSFAGRDIITNEGMLPSIRPYYVSVRGSTFLP